MRENDGADAVVHDLRVMSFLKPLFAASSLSKACELTA